MKSNYSEILKDPRWQRKRLEILGDRGFRCEWCWSDKLTLHVHHQYYVKGRLPWEYPEWCFQVLCKTCHDIVPDSILEARDNGWEVICTFEASINNLISTNIVDCETLH